MIACSNDACDARLDREINGVEQLGWRVLGPKRQVYCPKCVWMIGLVQDVSDGKLTMDEGVEKLLTMDGAP